MRNRLAYLVTAFFLTAPGCLYHGYNPNGYYGPGSTYPPGQPMNVYPSTPTYQPGMPTYQPGTPVYTPGGNSPTPINGGNQPTFTPSDPNSNPQTYGSPGGNNSAPPFNPTPGSGNNSGGVPNPGDDGNSDFNRGGANRNPLTPTTSAASPNDLSTPFGQPESRLPRNFTDDTADNTFAPFEKPVLQATGSQSDVQQVSGQAAAGRPAKIYSHHPQFNWVQGVVEYDEPSNTWVIMYDDNPRTSDPFGGELTLGGNLNAAGVNLRSGDVVRIAGALDQTEEDARGRPIFQASKIQKIQ